MPPSEGSPKQIIVFGLCVWAGACVSTAFSQSYWMILISCMFVGVGEAAYAGYTVTIIDNMAPPKSRTLGIGTFYSMIPVGTAVGLTGGGILSKLASNGSIPGWRLVFATEILPMLPIIVFNELLPKKYNPVRAVAKKEESEEAPEEQHRLNDSIAEEGAVAPLGEAASLDDFVTLPKAVKLLAGNLNYVLLVFGYAMYTFVLGAIAVWAIQMLEQGPLHMEVITASVFMGGATAITGLLGSVCGGLFVDKMGGSKGLSGVVQCQKYMVTVMCLSIPCGAAAFLCTSLPLFACFFTVGVFLLFSVTAPINSAILSTVPLSLRTYGISFSVFFIHMLGDFPSPIIAGVISDKFSGGCDQLSTSSNATCSLHTDCRWIPAKKGENPSCVNIYQLRNAMLCVWCVMILAVPAWATVGIRASRQLKKEQEEAELRTVVDGPSAGVGVISGSLESPMDTLKTK